MGLLAASQWVGPAGYSPGVEGAVDYFRKAAGEFAVSCTQLRKAVEGPEDLGALRLRLADARLRYKRIESFLEYFFRSSATIYNRPPKFEAEDGGMEYQEAVGLQLMEALLYAPAPDRHALLEQAKAVESSAVDLPALLYELKADDRQLLESLRIELIRVIALDITGYEAPLLKSGIVESRAAMEAIEMQLRPYLDGGKRADSVGRYLGICLDLLKGDFDGFDRVRFLREAALPLQRQLGLFIREKGLQLNTTKTLNYAAEDIFSPDAFLVRKFPGGTAEAGGAADSAELAARGRRLFFDSSLSGNGRKSCASCHNPSRAFTDGLPVSIGLDGHERLDRNAPTLLYSAYQFSQFWDGRVKSLEEQIRTVLHNPREMGATTVREGDVAAIAAYVRSLHPMNSLFDRYIRSGPGDEGGLRGRGALSDGSLSAGALSAGARRGANLFMGKAQCATCHFIPFFNGLIPPDYAVSEFEVLGTTEGDDFGHPRLSGLGDGLRLSGRGDGLRLSRDSGRYGAYPLPFFRGAFKTPTVRDAALTAPYMHDGGFRSLETVLQFYNAGGGAGMGLSVPDQTLSSDSLRLSTGEMNDIILFIRTLTDSLSMAP
jgi:cytochrome c peroxidase